MNKPCILVVDDQQAYLRTIAEILDKSDYQVLLANNGQVACDVAKKHLPDMIIMDWEMPVMNGIEAIKVLKSDEMTQDIPVIMATGVMTSPENLQTALDVGAVDYIRKPVEEIELLARIHSTLKLSQSYRKIKKHEQQLLELNQLKDKLLSIISHDFKSPFNSLKGMLYLLSIEELDPEEEKKLIHGLIEKVNITSDYMDNILLWAKNQMQGLKLQPDMINLTELVEEVLRVVKIQADNKDISLITKGFDKEDHCYGDWNTIHLILRNLLSNALKYTLRKGTVEVSLKKHDKHVIISVSDDGIGMDQERLDKLFSFNINSITGTNKEKGTGLGLYISKEFIEMNKGEIWVESTINEGSTFYFSLPAYL